MNSDINPDTNPNPVINPVTDPITDPTATSSLAINPVTTPITSDTVAPVPITPVTAPRQGLRQRLLGSLRNWFRRTNRTRRARSSSR